MQVQPEIISQNTRQVAAVYMSYPEAQAAVDHLSDRGFPVERAAIVAEGLRFVEQVTGRRTYGSAALHAAIAGALVGALIGFFFGLLDLVDPLVSGLVLAGYGLVFGAVFGAIFGLISYAMSGGRRDFSSVTGMDAERYLLMVDPEVADEAGRLLSAAEGAPVTPVTS